MISLRMIYDGLLDNLYQMYQDRNELEKYIATHEGYCDEQMEMLHDLKAKAQMVEKVYDEMHKVAQVYL